LRAVSSTTTSPKRAKLGQGRAGRQKERKQEGRRRKSNGRKLLDQREREEVFKNENASSYEERERTMQERERDGELRLRE